ncbi:MULTISPECIES: TylF/MycF/NovP-related O-methyltransferase [Empedobacter]|uniref:Methyltransferase n=1 Tax=Empedobacter falsenii TaxID=343874 RepID=A0A7H9DNZ8_9FLAO|nr:MULTISPECIES: TylF/MycF/NovP-related O-methyltransferase [Empedobacter]MDM1547549.1 class I SAM-dependent methyltransferase [Empedobacter falsenii]QLL56888.1 methyltransferase [Empedobacter falsenii]
MKEIFRIDDNIFYHSKWQDRSASQKFKHSLILPINTYSPWNGDSDFVSAYEKAKNNTLLDIYRCYELWDLAKQYSNKDGDILEVGVWRGGSSLLLASADNGKGHVFLCDTFSGVVKASDKDSIYKGGEHADTSEEEVKQLFATAGISNYSICKGIFPDESEQNVTSEKFKICHIDVDVYQSAKDIFEWVHPKLIKGGAVIFDDYGFAACEGITTLVHDIISEYQNYIKIYNINGHAILIKTDD